MNTQQQAVDADQRVAASSQENRPEPVRSRRRRSRSPEGFETIDAVLLTEPRLEAIRQEVQALLRVVQLESGGEPIEVDGFRIRDVSHWADYSSSLSDIFWHLSSVCNFHCEFCYELGNPDDFPIQSIPRMSSEAEIDTRLRYYDPLRRTGVFSLRTAINEPFANKRAIHFLRAMRAKAPTEMITFVTNGSYLTEEVVRELPSLQPLFFNLSIYSTDPDVRRRVILDRRGEVAVRAVDLLREYEIPYMTNLVMWPSIPFSDMERTIEFMSARQATVMRVCLGGYSRYLKGSFQRFEVDEYWPQVVAEVERIRDRYSIPILIEPNSYVRHDTDAVLDGVITGSPAARAGLRRGDVVRHVNDEPIHSRMQLLAALRGRGRCGYRPPGVAAPIEEPEQDHLAEATSLTIERDGARFSVRLNRFDAHSVATFPYSRIAHFDDFIYGLVVTDCLRYSSLRAARELMERSGAHNVLVLTSVMIEPILLFMLDRSRAFDGFNVTIRVADNRFFGGTINVGDLLVVEDFVGAIRDQIAECGYAPDLVLIPESPFASSPWGRDLTGRPWRDIERLSGVPVRLVPCSNITY